MNAEQFQPHRKRVLGLAYRMLGSVASAEDVVQEAWVRWVRADDVEQPAAWLTTVATRLCLDELKSARARREEHVGPWLPEPWIEEAPPEPGAWADSLSMAFLLLLEELSPRERAAFLLREVFDEDYERIALVLETTEANARQLVRRARTAIDRDQVRFDADPVAQAALLVAFGAACRSGDQSEIERLLADEVVGLSDGGGRATAARVPLLGKQRLGRFLSKIMGKLPPEVAFTFAWVNGCPGVITWYQGRPYSVTALEVRNGKIVGYKNVLDPWKLGRVPTP